MPKWMFFSEIIFIHITIFFSLLCIENLRWIMQPRWIREHVIYNIYIRTYCALGKTDQSETHFFNTHPTTNLYDTNTMDNIQYYKPLTHSYFNYIIYDIINYIHAANYFYQHLVCSRWHVTQMMTSIGVHWQFTKYHSQPLCASCLYAGWCGRSRSYLIYEYLLAAPVLKIPRNQPPIDRQRHCRCLILEYVFLIYEYFCLLQHLVDECALRVRIHIFGVNEHNKYEYILVCLVRSSTKQNKKKNILSIHRNDINIFHLFSMSQ